MTDPALEVETPAIDSDLLDPYERLIEIEVLGKKVAVPEKNRLLRCFQYLSLSTISYGDFCWNGECTNCQVWCRLPGQSETDKPVLACRQEVIEGMVVTSVSNFIKIDGITDQRSEVGGQRSEVRDQKSEVSGK